MSTPNAPGSDQWRVAQQTATMPAVQQPVARPVNRSSTAAVTAPSKARKARLVLARVDPWSVMKLGFLLSIALAIVAVVAVFVLWTVLDTMGVFDSVGSSVESITRSSDNAQGVDILAYIGLNRVLSITMVLAGVNIVLMTALFTLAAFLYNMAASLVGGLHVTFTEDV